MKLVFFDIECASVFKNVAKICAFGYCVCDMNFNLIEKRDVLINPKGKFHLTDRSGEKGLVLPYEYSDFKKYPTFPAVYKEIKNLLENKEHLVFGHATCNDVRYLSLETKRFNLPSFNFEYYDSQILYMAQTGDFSRQYGLEYITKDLDVVFTPHRAADDAYATMKVVQAICEKCDCGIEELNARFCVKAGKIDGEGVSRTECKGLKEYENEKQRVRQARELTRKQFAVFLSRMQKHADKNLGGIFENKTFCFSKGIEDDLTTSVKLINKIYEKGGTYTKKTAKCNTFIKLDGEDSIRLRNVLLNGNIKVMSLDEFKELLND